MKTEVGRGIVNDNLCAWLEGEKNLNLWQNNSIKNRGLLLVFRPQYLIKDWFIMVKRNTMN